MTAPDLPTYWDDYEGPLTIGSRSRTITEADLIMWSGLVGDWSPLHVDIEHARRGPFGERIVHGNVALNLAVSLAAQADRGSYRPAGYVRLLGWESVRFTAPVHLGDTLRAERTLSGREEADDPTLGVVLYAVRVLNQHGEAVLVARERVLVRRRPPGGPNGSMA